ncbi:hypothetical protein OIU76_004204 [Salix suchowensis]|nr:hypothetical protein OIU76_004204 [Salix suchowensis]
MLDLSLKYFGELEVNFFPFETAYWCQDKGLGEAGKVCTSKGEKIALSRRVEKHWRLIGWGMIQAGTTIEVPPCPL